MLGEGPPPPAEPRRVGALLTAALPGQVRGGTDWRKGVITWPEAAPGWDLVADCDPAQVDYGLGEGAAPVGAVPFLIRTLTRCPMSTDLSALRERADRQIRAVTSTAIARELWTGALSKDGPWSLPDVPFELANPRPDAGTDNAGPWLNPHLDAAEMLTGPFTMPAEAVAAAEAAAADRMAGGPVFLHVPAEWVLELGQFGIAPQGDLIRTPLGSVVVADPGYPGTAGEAGPEACFATGPVQVWLDEPRIYDDPQLVVSAENNVIGMWAERPALVLFDPQTLVGAAVTPGG